jgi:uncharacterized repeat protein (TIGR01451 family)
MNILIRLKLLIKVKKLSRTFVVWLLLCLCVPQITWGVPVAVVPPLPVGVVAPVAPATVLSWGAATAAGSVISNTAQVSYSIGSIPQSPQISNTVTILVDEVIYPLLTCANSTVIVNSPGVNDPLTFTLSNYGNGVETFSLTRTNVSGVAPAKYTPLTSVANSIFYESNGLAGFQSGMPPLGDAIYAGSVTVAAGKSLPIYVLSDTPSGVASTATGDVQLLVTSLTPGAATAAVNAKLTGVGDKNAVSGVATNAVVYTLNGSATTSCNYTASGLGFVMAKTIISSTDPVTGVALQDKSVPPVPMLIPGAIVTYQISVRLTGVGAAAALIINDPLPANTTYVPGSISVSGVAQTDAADADKARFLANTISVSLGVVVAPTPVDVLITFRATIN